MHTEVLTEKQQHLFEFLRCRQELGEPCPSYREICEEFGWSSTGTARDYLRALTRKGYVQPAHGRARALCVKDRGTPAIQVPLIGRIVAGTPIETQESIESYIPVPADWVTGCKCFALRVTGDSMTNAGILDGDQVVADFTANARDGDIVVATVDGETTLKRLKKRSSRWWLIPENSRYSPIPIHNDSVLIQGVMVGLLRYGIAKRNLHKPTYRGAKHDYRQSSL